MEKVEIKSQLTVVFNTVFNKEVEITDELTASDVDGWDSLSHMLLISEVEKAFNIKFKLKELNKMKNVGAMINLIIDKTK